MTLGFSTKWPERMGELAVQPNYFVEKIWEGLINNKISDDLAYDSYKVQYLHQFDNYWDGYPLIYNPKLHTIREDKHDRWKAGNDIHFVINNRTKDRFQFAPVVKCTGVQDIEIFFFPTFNSPEKLKSHRPYVKVDGNNLTDQGIEELAINDGFPSVEAFFQYFNANFKGKIIHWTKTRY